MLKLLWKNIVKSFFDLKDRIVLSAISLDIMFVFLYGFIASKLFAKVMEYVNAIGLLVAQNSGMVMDKIFQNGIINTITSTPELVFYFKRLAVLVFLNIIIFYLIYSLLHGWCWKLLSAKIRANKFNYLKQFFLINLLWLPFFLIQQSLSLFIDLRNTAIKSINPLTVLGTNYTSYILLFVIVYFALISYALIGKFKVKEVIKKTFVIGIKKFPQILLAYISLMVVFIAINYLWFLTVKINYGLSLFLSIILLFTAFSYTRFMILNSINNIR